MTGKGSARRPTNAEAYDTNFDNIFRKKTMSEWQPIETAPRDGTDVLVHCHHGFYVAGYYERDIEWWHVDDNKHGPFPLRGTAPTHWMPLPPPPKDQP